MGVLALDELLELELDELLELELVDVLELDEELDEVSVPVEPAVDEELESLLVPPELPVEVESEDDPALPDETALAVELVPEPEVAALVEPAVLEVEVELVLVLGKAHRQTWKPLPSALQAWPPSQPPTPTQATDWPGMQSAAPLVPDELVELAGSDPEQPATTIATTHRTLRMTPPGRAP